MKELPAGWSQARLEELFEIVLGGDWGKDPEETVEGSSLVRCIRAAELRDWETEKGRSAAIRRLKNSSVEKRRLRCGDILVEISGGGPDQAVGRTVLITQEVLNTENSRDFVCTNFFRFFRPTRYINAAYLNWYLRHFYSTGGTEALQGGSNNLRNLRFPNYSEQQIPLAPFNEQRRIVAKIEELFSELDKGIESLTTAREQLKAYRRSVLNRAVVGERGVSLAFPSKPLSAVVEELGQGWSPRCLNHPAADDETWAVITTTAIQHGVFQEQENKQIPKELEPRPHLAIRAGDILITRAGPRKRVGVACLVRDCRPRLMLCDKAYRLRADTGQVLPEWLELVLNSPSILQEVEELKTGISDSGVNLTQNRFLELDVPIPTLAEQQAVLKVVDSLTSQMTNLEAQIETAMRQSDALRQSTLKRAFSGHLVVQTPSDEPASILLERIRFQRDEGGTIKRRNNKNGKKEAA